MSSLPTGEDTPTSVKQHILTMQQNQKEQLECVNPVEDLVVFEPIKGTYMRGQHAVARYSLGSDFCPSSWDWVGLFPEGWTSYREYISYHWAPSIAIDPRRANRRSVLFTSDEFEAAKNIEDSFQFLYVTSWNHVVGVSPHFRLEGVIGIDEDLCFDLMENSIERPLTSKALVKRKFSGDELFPDKGDLHFDVLESSIQGAKKPKPTLAPFTFVNMNKPDICFPLKLDGDLGFDLLQKFECQRQEWAFSAMTRTESDGCDVKKEENIFSPQIVATKQKVLTIVRDHESLAGAFVPNPEKPLITDFQQLLYLNPVVKTYVENREMSIVPYDLHKPIFDINSVTIPSVTKIREMERKVDASTCTTYVPEIEYPIRLPIMPGPKSVLLTMDENAKRCRTCALGKTVTTDCIHQGERTERAMDKLRDEIRSLRKQIQHAKSQRKLVARQKDILYRDVVERRNQLEDNVRSLERQLEEAKRDAEESAIKVQVKLISSDSISDRYLKEAFHLLVQRGFRYLVDSEGIRYVLEQLSAGTDEDAGWTVRSPKRIAQMRVVISNQSATIQNLAGSVISQREAISRQVNTMQDLRKNVTTLESANKDKDRRMTDMTRRVRALLRARSKDLTNEWRLFAQKIREPVEPVAKSKSARKSGLKKGHYSSNISKQSLKFSPYTTRKPEESTASVGVVAPAIPSIPNVVFVNESAPETRVVRRKKTALAPTMCKTCGQAFGPEVSPHVVEEHLLFHERFGKKWTAMM